jgi:Lon protease-like protein
MSGERNILSPKLVIPVFPLPNVVLFPKVQLPLHIFEPRYRQMVKDAMADQRLIGMALLRGQWEKDYSGNPEIYPVGCVGRVIGITPLPDGRYNILLYGLREYAIEEQILHKTPYRQAKVVLRDQPRELESAFLATLKREILELARQTLGEEGAEVIKLLGDPSIDGESWLNLCCFCLDISTLERQSLLEAKSLQERGRNLLDILRFIAIEKGTPSESLRGSRESKLPH